jgi:hypothetical protein
MRPNVLDDVWRGVLDDVRAKRRRWNRTASPTLSGNDELHDPIRKGQQMKYKL